MLLPRSTASVPFEPYPEEQGKKSRTDTRPDEHRDGWQVGAGETNRPVECCGYREEGKQAYPVWKLLLFHEVSVVGSTFRRFSPNQRVTRL